VPCKYKTFWQILVIQQPLNIVASLDAGGDKLLKTILVAPSRHDIDQSRAQKKTWDIGVPSLRNFVKASRYRKIIW
jgi:hypothetical protein